MYHPFLVLLVPCQAVTLPPQALFAKTTFWNQLYSMGKLVGYNGCIMAPLLLGTATRARDNMTHNQFDHILYRRPHMYMNHGQRTTYPASSQRCSYRRKRLHKQWRWRELEQLNSRPELVFEIEFARSRCFTARFSKLILYALKSVLPSPSRNTCTTQWESWSPHRFNPDLTIL